MHSVFVVVIDRLLDHEPQITIINSCFMSSFGTESWPPRNIVNGNMGTVMLIFKKQYPTLEYVHIPHQLNILSLRSCLSALTHSTSPCKKE